MGVLAGFDRAVLRPSWGRAELGLGEAMSPVEMRRACGGWPMPVRTDNRFGLVPMAFAPGALGFRRDAGMGEVVQLFIEDDLTMQKGVSWISPTPPLPPEAPPRWT